MRSNLKRKLRHFLFYLAVLVMGATVAESDIITGHHCMEYMHQARVHYVEEPVEEESEDV